MNEPTSLAEHRARRARPGHWCDQGVPLGPTPEEHQVYINTHSQPRPSNPWVFVALVVLMAASPFIAGLAIYLHFFA
jgi:hypothetical protein